MPRRPGPAVRVLEIRERLDDRTRSPYRVRWVVGRRNFERGFRSKTRAQDLAARLRVAANDGERFDPASGLPLAWTTSDESYASYAHRWLHRDWDARAPRGRKAVVEDLLPSVCLLVRPSATPLTPAVRLEVRGWLADPDGEMPAYLARYSLPLEDLDELACERAQAVAMLQWDSRFPRADHQQNRIRRAAQKVLGAAVKERLLVEQPWKTTERSLLQSQRQQRREGEVVRREDLPTPAQVQEMLGRVVNHQPSSRNYLVLFTVMFWAGLRPSEAAVVSIETIKLPKTDDEWGTIEVIEADKRAGAAYTKEHERIGVTKTARSRTLPIPPQLVAFLREEIGDRKRGPLVATRHGNPPSPSNIDRSFERIRLDERWTPYSLRYAAATLWLDAGVPPGEVARRLGHSIEVLLRDYAGVLSGSVELGNARIQKHLGQM